MKYLIGQRVIVHHREIGTVVKSETGKTVFGIWIYIPSKGCAVDYYLDNVKPLPNNQL